MPSPYAPAVNTDASDEENGTLRSFFKKISHEDAAAAKRVELGEMRVGREERKREPEMEAKQKEDKKRKKETLRKALYRAHLKDEKNIGVDIAVGSKNYGQEKGECTHHRPAQ